VCTQVWLFSQSRKTDCWWVWWHWLCSKHRSILVWHVNSRFSFGS